MWSKLLPTYTPPPLLLHLFRVFHHHWRNWCCYFGSWRVCRFPWFRLTWKLRCWFAFENPFLFLLFQCPLHHELPLLFIYIFIFNYRWHRLSSGCSRLQLISTEQRLAEDIAWNRFCVFRAFRIASRLMWSHGGTHVFRFYRRLVFFMSSWLRTIFPVPFFHFEGGIWNHRGYISTNFGYIKQHNIYPKSHRRFSRASYVCELKTWKQIHHIAKIINKERYSLKNFSEWFKSNRPTSKSSQL